MCGCPFQHHKTTGFEYYYSKDFPVSKVFNIHVNKVPHRVSCVSLKIWNWVQHVIPITTCYVTTLWQSNLVVIKHTNIWLNNPFPATLYPQTKPSFSIGLVDKLRFLMEYLYRCDSMWGFPLPDVPWSIGPYGFVIPISKESLMMDDHNPSIPCFFSWLAAATLSP